MTNLIEITETDTEYIVKGNLKLIKDFKTNKNLIVKGNILGDDKERYNLRARDIYAQDIHAIRDIGARDIHAIRDIGARDIYARDIYARDIDAIMDIYARDIHAIMDIDVRDIYARDIDVRDIDARHINAWDIICETREKRSEDANTTARIFIKNKSKLERKEWK